MSERSYHGATKENEVIYTKKWDSVSDFSRDSDYNEFANEIQLVSIILHPFEFQPIFTAAEIQTKTTYLVLVHSL